MADDTAEPTLEQFRERLTEEGANADLSDVSEDVLRLALDHDDEDVVANIERELELREREALEAAGENDGPEGPPPVEPEAALVFALATAQAEFPTIAKTHTGEVRGKTKDGAPYSYDYKYADLADVLNAVRPVLARNGLALTQHTAHQANGGKVLLVTRLKHVAGAELTTEVELGQSPGSPQQFGGALTYLRRYSIVTLLGIAAEEDLDAANVEPVRANGASAAPERVEVLPAWAAPLEDDSVRRQLVAALTDLVGNDVVAKRYAGELAKRTGGKFPHVIAAWLLALPKFRQAGDRENANRAQAAAEAPDDTRGQDAAEQPDEPAGPPVPANKFPPLPGTGGRPPTPDELAARGGIPVGDDLAAGLEEAKRRAETPDGELFDADAPSPEEAEAAREEAAGRPAPGTVDLPDLEGADLTKLDDRDRARKLYRQAGCVCKEPLVVAIRAMLEDNRLEHDNPAVVDAIADDATTDTCPLKRHGIPFL